MGKLKQNTSGCAEPPIIHPNGIYTIADLIQIFGVGRTAIVKWKKEKNLPLTGAPRGTITGRALLEWVENRGKGTA